MMCVGMGFGIGEGLNFCSRVGRMDVKERLGSIYV